MRGDDQIGDGYVNHLFNQVMDGNADRIVMLDALRVVALGRTDCGRPLAAEKSRQVARSALTALGETWKRK